MASEVGDRPKVNLYDDRVLAYVDILGWKDLISLSANDVSVLYAVTKAVDQLRSAGKRARALNKAFKDYGEPHVAIEVTVFSDTVVLSCRPDDEALRLLVAQLQLFCTDLMVAGFYTRGAIVRGALRHQGGVIFGPALIGAYSLESTVAKYPRIIIADEVRPAILGLAFGDSATIASRYVLTDHDGLPYLSLFSGNREAPDTRRQRLLDARARVDADLKKHDADLGIRAKLVWLYRHLEAQIGDADDGK